MYRIRLLFKNYKWLVLLVFLYFCTIEAYPKIIEARENSVIKTVQASTNYTTKVSNEKKLNVSVSATVDEYLSVYNKSQSIHAATNLTNEYYADEKICILNY